MARPPEQYPVLTTLSLLGRCWYLSFWFVSCAATEELAGGKNEGDEEIPP